MFFPVLEENSSVLNSIFEVDFKSPSNVEDRKYMTEPNVIILNGASSSGKSTFGKALKSFLGLPYFYLSSDQLVDADILPRLNRDILDQVDSWNTIRPKFFDAFHRTIKAFADAGNLVIVEHVVEQKEWLDQLVDLLRSQSVLYIGVHCPSEEIDRRERARGNRFIGEGRSHIQDGIHTWSTYDVEIDTFEQSEEENLQKVLDSIVKYERRKTIFYEESGIT